MLLTDLKRRITLCSEDITRLEVDAIVTAANASLLGDAATLAAYRAALGLEN